MASLPNLSIGMPVFNEGRYSAGKPAKSEWRDRVVRTIETRAIGPQEPSLRVGPPDQRNNGLPIDDARFADACLVPVIQMQMPPSQHYAFGKHALQDRPEIES